MRHYDTRSYSARSSIGYLMRRGGSLLREQLEGAYAPHGFTFVQWITLLLMRDNPTLSAGDLCRDLHHDSGAFTRILDDLEGRGLLVRRRSARDRRVVQLRLTAAGRRAIATLLPLLVEHLNHALEEFSAAEVATLTGLLGRLIARLENVPPPAAAPAPTRRPAAPRSAAVPRRRAAQARPRARR